MFEAALHGRVPENAMLSHDLFEGIFTRAGLVSDIEVVDEFPSRYDVASKRQHRWTRGDWQLLPWVLGLGVRGLGRPGRGVPAVGRGKMLDNLRRSLVAPSTFLGVSLCLLFPLPSAIAGVLLLFASIAVPALLPVLFAVAPRRAGIRLLSHLGALFRDIRLASAQILLSVAFLADQAWRMSDAIVRTLVRLVVTRRHLLEWTTAAQSTGRRRLDLGGFYGEMAGGALLALAVASGALALAPWSWPLTLPLALLWSAAPALALWTSRATTRTFRPTASEPDAVYLRLVARRTWRFFETFVTPADNMLPPDNFQETPKPVIAHRTSPTNIGLYLLSAVTARDFGWAGTMETIERIEATFATMKKLPLLNGHLFNWYDTRDLRPLDPAYVSCVDSGNLAGHMIALANTCEEWADSALAAETLLGLQDTLQLARDAVNATARGAPGRQIVLMLDGIDAQRRGANGVDLMLPALRRLTEKAASAARAVVPIGGDDEASDLVFWTEALGKAIAEHERDARLVAEAPDTVKARLNALADTARSMALAMDFAFLLNPERKLLSIGYSVAENELDANCYDLLASEARLASLFSIAKGDVTTRHWLRLGRAATPIGGGSALISWSGSMFEYLMPSLVMRAPVGS
jgi:cyclic beta-1,2-glucan synthetase